MMPMPPGRGQAPPTQNAPLPQAPPADVAALLGGGLEGQPPVPGSQDLKQGFQEMVRQLTGMASQMAEQYPAFAPFAEQIAKAAQEGLMGVLVQLGSQEPQPDPMAL